MFGGRWRGGLWVLLGSSAGCLTLPPLHAEGPSPAAEASDATSQEGGSELVPPGDADAAPRAEALPADQGGAEAEAPGDATVPADAEGAPQAESAPEALVAEMEAAEPEADAGPGDLAPPEVAPAEVEVEVEVEAEAEAEVSLPCECNDGIPCTKDGCQAGIGCTSVPEDDACADGNECTLDICSSKTGCTHDGAPKDGASCQDGDPCTSGEVCAGGACPTGPIGCDDSNPCTEDTCDPVLGCLHAANDGWECNDDSACTTGDACEGVECVGAPAECTDAEPCTADGCDPAVGCTNEIVIGPCEDGNPCTVGEACTQGQCGGGAPTECGDANPCKIQFCDPASGCGWEAAPEGAACPFGTCAEATQTCLFAYQSVVGGQQHTCALRADGTVWCWGKGPRWALGQGDIPAPGGWTKPTQVPGLADVTEISAGWWHTCALTSGGTFLCWGSNENGQLGTGALGGVSYAPAEPVKPAGFGAVSHVAAGHERTCAVMKADGAVYCFGRGGYGANGDGTDSWSGTPVPVVLASGDPLIGAKALALGYVHSCAVKTDGSVWCWGYNKDGELGNGAPLGSDSIGSPVQVVDAALAPLGGVAALAAGPWSVCALRENGSVWCWGLNDSGQLGDLFLTSRSTAGEVYGLEGDPAAVSLAGGNHHTCAALEDGSVRCWGYDQLGQLGDGAPGAPSPVAKEVTGGADAAKVGAGYSQSCAIDSRGRIACWGRDPMAAWHTTPDQVPIGFTPKELSSHDATACAIDPAGGLWCWGANSAGRAGVGDDHPRDVPVPVPDMVGAAHVSVAALHTCVVKVDKSVWCWGGGDWWPNLGTGKNGTFTTPQEATLVPQTMVAIATGDAFSCALDDTGTVTCWGENFFSACGQPGGGQVLDPAPVQGAEGVAQIVAGAHHACALEETGKVVCWGENLYGQLGDGTENASSSTPVEVLGLEGVVKITSAYYHTCALRDDQTAWCWGHNGESRLGASYGGGWSAQALQVAIPVDLLDISVGEAYGCAVRADNKVVCWGANWSGQLGGGAIGCCPTTVAQGLTGATAVMAGTATTCATKGDGTLHCWGSNEGGATGLGTFIAKTPAPVADLP